MIDARRDRLTASAGLTGTWSAGTRNNSFPPSPQLKCEGKIRPFMNREMLENLSNLIVRIKDTGRR